MGPHEQRFLGRRRRGRARRRRVAAAATCRACGPSRRGRAPTTIPRADDDTAGGPPAARTPPAAPAPQFLSAMHRMTTWRAGAAREWSRPPSLPRPTRGQRTRPGLGAPSTSSAAVPLRRCPSSTHGVNTWWACASRRRRRTCRPDLPSAPLRRCLSSTHGVNTSWACASRRRTVGGGRREAASRPAPAGRARSRCLATTDDASRGPTPRGASGGPAVGVHIARPHPARRVGRPHPACASGGPEVAARLRSDGRSLETR